MAVQACGKTRSVATGFQPTEHVHPFFPSCIGHISFYATERLEYRTSKYAAESLQSREYETQLAESTTAFAARDTALSRHRLQPIRVSALHCLQHTAVSKRCTSLVDLAFTCARLESSEIGCLVAKAEKMRAMEGGTGERRQRVFQQVRAQSAKQSRKNPLVMALLCSASQRVAQSEALRHCRRSNLKYRLLPRGLHSR